MRPSASMRWGACFPGKRLSQPVPEKRHPPRPISRSRALCSAIGPDIEGAREFDGIRPPCKTRGCEKYVPLPVLAVTAVKIRAALPGQRFTILGFSGVRKSWGTVGLGGITPGDMTRHTPPGCNHSAETAHFWSKTHVFARMAPAPVLELKAPENLTAYP